MGVLVRLTPGVIGIVDPTTTTRSPTSTTNAVHASYGDDLVTVNIETVPIPPPIPTHIPFGMGTIKNMATTLPDVSPATLQPFSVFHGGDFSEKEVKDNMHTFPAHNSCQAFTTVRLSDNRIKIIHSIGRYIAPLGFENNNRNHNYFFCFKGDRTKR